MTRVLLHSCCAPCSAAIAEWMMQNDFAPTIFFFNPNIYPEEEYFKRKDEIVRYAAENGIPIVDEDIADRDAAEETAGKDVAGETAGKDVASETAGRDAAEETAGKTWRDRHEEWLEECREFADEPERGKRCLTCFKYRLCAVAGYAAGHGFPLFTTTLASSRWKDIRQIVEAGQFAEAQCGGGKTKFWDKNWRKGGLYERRNILAKQFYNQQYCGCEYSMRRLSEKREREMRVNER